MLAAKNRWKKAVLILSKNGANLDLVNAVSVHNISCITKPFN